ncbi:712_t:CDS:2, partial [Paraglomus occultum]
RSPYFRVALSANWVRKEANKIMYKKPNILPEILEIIMTYIYTGVVAIEDQGAAAVFDVLLAADELILPEVQDHAEEHLIANESLWLRTNFSYVHKAAFRHQGFRKLQEYYLNMICKKPSMLFESEDFCSTDSDILVMLSMRDDLDMEEIELWDYLVKWGMAQCSSLAPDPADWSEEDFTTFESTMHGCIEHVRFFNIRSQDFYLKVMPLKKIVPIDLYKDLERYHYKVTTRPRSLTKSPRQKTIRSNIVEQKYIKEITSWINGRDPGQTSEEPPTVQYDFRLLVRGSRDGFSSTTFHDRCDDQGATLLIVKVQGSGQVIGGYNPVSWGSDNTWSYTKDSFIFSFIFGETGSSVLSRVRVKQAEHAVYNSDIFGPCFGRGDLCMGKNFSEISGSYAKTNDYERKILWSIPGIVNNNTDSNTRFSVEDYEVFQVVKKKSSK